MSNIDDLPPPPGAQTSAIDDLPPPPKMEPVDDTPGVGEAALRGAAQGASAGFADEATAGVGGLGDYLKAKMGARGDISLRDAYNSWKHAIQARDHQAKAAQPVAYNFGEGAGTGLLAAAPGLGALNAGKGAGLAELAGKSALQAGTTAYGKSEADDAADDLKNTAEGAAAGAVAGPLVHGVVQSVGEMAGKVAPAVNDFAENRAATALGWTKALRKKFGNDAAMTAGRVGLDNGVVTPLANTADKLEGMQAVKDAAGQTIGGTMDKLDQAGIKEFNPKVAADRVGTEIGDAYANEPLFQGLKGQYDNLLQTINQRGNQPISFADAQKLKEVLGQYGYKSGMAVPGREQAQQATGIVKKALDEAVDRGAAQTGNTDLLANLQNARKEYGAAKNTLGALDNKVAGEQGNNAVSLPTKVLAAGTGPGAIIKAGANILGNKYGANTTAYGADKIAQLLSASPEALGQYAGPLAAAAAKSPDAFRVVHNLLMKSDPAYANLVNKD